MPTMKTRGIQWGLHDRLENLDYADNNCLFTLLQRHAGKTPSHSQRSIISWSAETQVKERTSILSMSVAKDGGTNFILSRIRKATVAYYTKTLKIFNTNVKSFLRKDETWKVTRSH